MDDLLKRHGAVVARIAAPQDPANAAWLEGGRCLAGTLGHGAEARIIIFGNFGAASFRSVGVWLLLGWHNRADSKQRLQHSGGLLSVGFLGQALLRDLLWCGGGPAALLRRF